MFLKYIKKIFNKKEIDKKNFSNKFKELGKKKGPVAQETLYRAED